MKYQVIWRNPAEESHGFPKLMVHDNCVSGSINIRNSRLPLWAIIITAIIEGWEAVEDNWPSVKDCGYTKEDLAHFLYCLLEQRGEFGRLILLLAKLESREDGAWYPWWEKPSDRKRLIKQLQNCMDALKGIELLQ